MNEQIKNLSYSSLLLLHSCPRKFQLYRLNIEEEDEEPDADSSLTFAFGHIVGEGIQLSLQGFSEDEIIWELFKKYPCPLDQADEKRKKSFYHGIHAVQTFHSRYLNGNGILLTDYELVIMPNGKPAVELSFVINCPDGFRYRGFVDAILRHRITGEIVILENKTSSARIIQPGMYQNSSQAIGYSVVLDVLFPEYSSYKVIYCVYKTTEFDFDVFHFGKSAFHRALWIQDILFDIENIKMYENAGVYPMRGESCLGKYFKTCRYLNICTLSTENLISSRKNEPKPDTQVYDFTFDMELLIKAQLEK